MGQPLFTGTPQEQGCTQSNRVTTERNGVRSCNHTHFAARGEGLVHLVSSICIVCLVRRTRETGQPRAPDRLPLNRPPLASPYTAIGSPRAIYSPRPLLTLIQDFVYTVGRETDRLVGGVPGRSQKLAGRGSASHWVSTLQDPVRAGSI